MAFSQRIRASASVKFVGWPKPLLPPVCTIAGMRGSKVELRGESDAPGEEDGMVVGGRRTAGFNRRRE
jgi:hypothetical protein